MTDSYQYIAWYKPLEKVDESYLTDRITRHCIQLHINWIYNTKVVILSILLFVNTTNTMILIRLPEIRDFEGHSSCD